MSGNQDGIMLRHQELVALLALGGKQQFYCYCPNVSAYTEQELWSSCCNLMAEQMMTQVNEQFQLREDLYDVIMPILQADKALVFRIRKMEPSVIFYVANEAVAVESTIFGRYSMQMMEVEDVIERIMTQNCIHYYDSVSHPTGENEMESAAFHMPERQLVEQSIFLLTWVEPDDGKIRGWLRGVQNGAEPWLQVADETGTKSMILTQENFRAEVTKLVRGNLL